MKTIKTIAILLIASNTLYGQTKSETAEPKPFIEITGIAEKEIIPDEIFISITLTEKQDNKKRSIDEQEADLKKAVKDLGINSDNLFLSDANANYVYVKWAKRDVVAKKTYLLKVNDALTVGKVFEKLDEIDVKNPYISKVNHSKIEEHKKEVRIAAMKAAKEKADYLLTAIGEQTGKPIEIKEQNNSNVILANGMANKALSDEFYYGASVKDNSDQLIQFQKIKLQASIYAKFEIR